jgi:hypothetical protein
MGPADGIGTSTDAAADLLASLLATSLPVLPGAIPAGGLSSLPFLLRRPASAPRFGARPHLAFGNQEARMLGPSGGHFDI